MHFCSLLIFSKQINSGIIRASNNLDPDQSKKVRLGLDQNCLQRLSA